ncbi:MAG: prepilin-type N-terminal cleavage/methylation domain-containing protein [Sideroxydans sp.]|nr:prepilin-type N-terminal cleavage/methylation domain-containing protein [Sideroxydans sp.]
MKQAQQGFTLIELMIVVAIIGILAAVAIPAYNDYTKKARFSEVISVSDSYKTAVSVCFAETNDLTTCDAGANGVPAAPAATTNLASIAVVDGVITATGNANTGGYTSILSPVLNAAGSALVWGQTGTCVAVGYCK